MTKWRVRREGDFNPRRWKLYAGRGPAESAEAFCVATGLPEEGRTVEVQFGGPSNTTAGTPPWVAYRVAYRAGVYAQATMIDAID